MLAAEGLVGVSREESEDSTGSGADVDGDVNGEFVSPRRKVFLVVLSSISFFSNRE
jgi:hypothetical protein